MVEFKKIIGDFDFSCMICKSVSCFKMTDIYKVVIILFYI